MASEPTRNRIIEALLALAAERPFREIGLADIADRAEMALTTLRETYDGRLDILADFSRGIDLKVLAAGPEAPDEDPRERLFDVMMRRFDALAPHKQGLRGLARAATCDPVLALALCRIAGPSQAWMLAAAGLGRGGLRGALRSEGLLLVYLRVLKVWLKDDDPGLGPTMAALDRALERGQRVAALCDRLAGCVEPFFGCLPRRHAPRRRGTASPTEGAEASA